MQIGERDDDMKDSIGKAKFVWKKCIADSEQNHLEKNPANRKLAFRLFRVATSRAKTNLQNKLLEKNVKQTRLHTFGHDGKGFLLVFIGACFISGWISTHKMNKRVDGCCNDVIT